MLARAHQTMIWARHRQTNQLRSALREFYPAALDAFDDLTAPRRAGRAGDRAAPRPGRGAVALQDRRRACAAAADQRRIDERAAEIQAALRAEQLGARPGAGRRDGRHRRPPLVAVIAELNTQIADLEPQLADRF